MGYLFVCFGTPMLELGTAQQAKQRKNVTAAAFIELHSRYAY
jgi:hypothetical protein